MDKLNQQNFSIGDAEKLTGVSQRCLRSWEGRHIRLPDRIRCGLRSYRRYSEMDIKLIKLIKEYQDQGFKLSIASSKAHADLGMKGVKDDA